MILELKTIADVGLVGFPNVGKSTLLSKMTKARPKIANYHFTTLSPNLGVCECYGEKFVVADIPGLIEGAADGAGLGIEFLRHIERTRMLVHVVDVSGVEGRDPYEDFLAINAELKNYSPALAKLKQIVALNKCDIFGAEEKIKEFKEKIGRKYKTVNISAVSGEGVDALKQEVKKALDKLPPRAAAGVRAVRIRQARKAGIRDIQGRRRRIRRYGYACGRAGAQRRSDGRKFHGVYA